MYQGAEFLRRVDVRIHEPSARLEECDRDGVDVRVLSTVAVMFAYWAEPEHTDGVAGFLNDDVAATASAVPDRFIGLGSLPLQDTDLAIAAIDRSIGRQEPQGTPTPTSRRPSRKAPK